MIISLSIESEKQNKSMMQWKAVRRDPHYLGMSKEGVAALDEMYSQWFAKCRAIEEKKKLHLANLLEFPDLPTQRKAYDIEGDWQKIKEYSMKLSQWMKELNLGQRLKFPQFESEAPPEGQQDQVMGEPETQPQEEWTIERLSKKLDDMLVLHEELEAMEPIDMYSDISQFDDKFIELNKKIQAIKVKKREKKVVEVLERQQGDLATFNENLKARNQEAADVQQKMKAMEDFVAELKKQTEELNKVNEEVYWPCLTQERES